MSKGNKKEKWRKPQLIILTRGKPEEAVLTMCACEPKTAPDSARTADECHSGPPCLSCFGSCGT